LNDYVRVPEPPEVDPSALAFVFSDGRLFAGGPGLELPQLSLLDGSAELAAGPLPLGLLDGRQCVAVGLQPGSEPGRGLAGYGLREVFAQVAEPVAAMAARASQMLEWWYAHAYCGRCGGPTELHTSETARVCTRCASLFFPRINPAVITLVHRDREILLAHDHRFRPGFFALLAGFVEPGETLEQTVVREVREEVGLEVSDLRYFASQAWPFPSQLMVGFFARYAGGDVTVQQAELSEARWFPLERLPEPENRPPMYTIAGRLIHGYQEEANGDAQRRRGQDVSPKHS
jgi:NAD+ diphosphatase